MATNNQLVLVGNLTRDFELRFTASGIAVANASLAYNTRVKDGDGWKDGDTSFFNLVVWRELAENASASLTKGSRVVVVGELKQRSWEDDQGEKRQAVELVVEAIGPELRFCTATVQRNDRQAPAGARPSPVGTTGAHGGPPPDEEPF